MLRRYKEIWYGVLFGMGAIWIDVLMHSRLQKRSVMEELFSFEPKTLVYRMIFIAFGVSLGLLMWRNGKREREFRKLGDRFANVIAEISPLVAMSYSKIQLELLRPESGTIPPALKERLYGLQSDLQRLRSEVEGLAIELLHTRSFLRHNAHAADRIDDFRGCFSQALMGSHVARFLSAKGELGAQDS